MTGLYFLIGAALGSIAVVVLTVRSILGEYGILGEPLNNASDRLLDALSCSALGFLMFIAAWPLVILMGLAAAPALAVRARRESREVTRRENLEMLREASKNPYLAPAVRDVLDDLVREKERKARR